MNPDTSCFRQDACRLYSATSPILRHAAYWMLTACNSQKFKAQRCTWPCTNKHRGIEHSYLGGKQRAFHPLAFIGHIQSARINVVTNSLANLSPSVIFTYSAVLHTDVGNCMRCTRDRLKFPILSQWCSSSHEEFFSFICGCDWQTRWELRWLITAKVSTPLPHHTLGHGSSYQSILLSMPPLQSVGFNPSLSEHTFAQPRLLPSNAIPVLPSSFFVLHLID